MNKSINTLLFDADGHKYTRDGVRYTSVSSIVGKYKQPYDKEYWSLYKAYERLLPETENFKTLTKGYKSGDTALFTYLNFFVDPKEAVETQKIILAEWDKERGKSIVKGNNFHNYEERLSHELGYSINILDGKQYPTRRSVHVYLENGKEYRKPTYLALWDLEDGFHPELILWADQLVGQADMIYIETIGDIRYVDVNDHKTNKVINKTNFFQKMKSPVSHLDDCHLNHYKLQISLYAWMMQQAGFKVRNTAFTHINKVYQFDYLEREVNAIMNIEYPKIDVSL